MVSKSFGIYGDNISGRSLVIETGLDYIACYCNKGERQSLEAFEFFNFDHEDMGDFGQLFSDIKLNSRLLSENNGAVDLVWAHDKAVCVPKVYFSEELVPSLLGIMHGVSGELRYSVSVLDDMFVVGYIPVNIAEVYEGSFNVSSNHHKYYYLLNAQRQNIYEQLLHVVFTSSSFIYSVYRGNRLLLIQTRLYKTADDMVYHLLNALKVLEMQASEVEVIASGMIGADSQLYKNLRAYFARFRFLESKSASFAAEGFHEYPLHYFASFCQQA